MRIKRDEIENNVQIITHNHAQKLHFSALVQLTKLSTDENTTRQPDQIKIFINSKMQRVDFTGPAMGVAGPLIALKTLNIDSLGQNQLLLLPI